MSDPLFMVFPSAGFRASSLSPKSAHPVLQIWGSDGALRRPACSSCLLFSQLKAVCIQVGVNCPGPRCARAARSAAHAILFEGIHVPSDITNMCMFRLGFPGENRTQEENNCRRSKRPKGADFFGCVEVSNIVIC